MCVGRAVELKRLFLDELQRAAELELDLSRVTEFDSAGVQLLLLTKRVADGSGKVLRLSRLSPVVREVFLLLDLTGHFSGLQVTAPSEAGQS